MREWLRTRVLPWTVWGVTMTTAAWLWVDVRQSSAVGFALGVEYDVAPPEIGRVDALAVAPGQHVRAGQVVATLDARALDAELEILAAERTRLEAELGAVRVETSVRVGDSSRELDESVETADLALKSARAERKVRAAEFQALSKQAEVLGDLVKDRMADRRELDALAVQKAALEQELHMADTLVQQLASQVASARARRTLLPSDATELALRPIRAALAGITSQEQLLAVRRSETVLRAPADGEVAAVHVWPGEVAAAGAPIVTIVSRGPGAKTEVQVCLPERQAGSVHLGEAVRLKPRGASGPQVPGHVTRLGAQISELPLRCRRNPEVAEWGRELTVALDEHAPLLPGQAFDVAFLGERSPLAGEDVKNEPPPLAPTPPTVANVALPRVLTVPPELSARTRFEPSALLWSAPLARFIIGSDDTGLEKQGEHAPWLFTMDASGRVDPAPRVVVGLEEVSDLEALAPGPKDSFYMLASQSRSRKGKRPPARQLFARVDVVDGELRLAASTQLADRLDADPALLARLGLKDTANLDLEGMTAVAGGGLLLGVKEPLDERGQAMLWHLARPDALLAGEDPASAGLTAWGSVPVKVRADGQDRPGGIAELLALPDGSLLISATASGAEPGQQDGALWHVRGRDALAEPRLVRSFVGLKPEGMALRDDGKSLVIVFDTGAEPPQWTELPWPAP